MIKFNFFSIDQVSLCCLVNNVSCKTKRWLTDRDDHEKIVQSLLSDKQFF